LDPLGEGRGVSSDLFAWFPGRLFDYGTEQ
jgi:hypothetical protein